MSFDVYIEVPECSACGRRSESLYQFNVTHNLNSIVEITLAPSRLKGCRPESGYVERSWGRLSGHTVRVVRPAMEAAEKILLDPERREEFRALEPENGWGTYAHLVVVYHGFCEQLAAAKDEWVIDARG